HTESLTFYTHTLSLHDALPILDFYSKEPRDIRIQLFSFNTNKAYAAKCFLKGGERWQKVLLTPQDFKSDDGKPLTLFSDTQITRSEEHTSELQSRFDLVCRLLL